MSNEYTIYWRTGRRELVRGADIAQAMTLAGYSGGAVRAIDFYTSENYRGYEWDKEKREWVLVAAPNAAV